MTLDLSATQHIIRINNVKGVKIHYYKVKLLYFRTETIK